MAGDWIKMRTDLRDDPAVIGIAARLGLDEDTVVGKLHRVWSWANRQTTDGNAPSVTKTWLDRYIGVTGWSDAMEKEGWIDFQTGSLVIPKFDRHNGKSAKERALGKERIDRYRNAPTVTKALLEKRREEKSKEEEAAGAAVRVKPSASRPPDPIWDTIMELWPSQSLTDSERGRRNKVVSELKKASATPDEIRARYKAMRRQYQNDPAKCTPMALASRWSEFAKQATITPSRAGGAPPPLSDEYRTSPASGLTPEQKREILQQVTSEVRK